MKLENDKIDFESSIAPWLGKTVKIVEFYLHEAMTNEGLDLSKEQMIILKKLHDQDGLNQNELAFLTLRNKSSLTRLLVKMENKGLIRRNQCAEDKRINHVYLTVLGREIFSRTRPLIQNLIKTMEQDISEGEIKQMIQLLQKIQFNFTSVEATL